MIGIIGYGMVGKAVAKGFGKTEILISDPALNDLSIEYMCGKQPDAIFVCVPTPTDDTNYATLKSVLQQIKDCKYTGLTVVKSTVLPQHLDGFDVLYNPEFLSRATAEDDFINPPFVLIGGDMTPAQKLADLYRGCSYVNMDCVKFTDIKTAALAKYMMNSFYALKVTYMNEMYDVTQGMGIEWDNLTDIFKLQPWMGSHHFQVPGPDGSRGFGGPCLPKDTKALVNNYNVELLKKALEINNKYRND